MISHKLYRERGRYIKLVPLLPNFASVQYLVIDTLNGVMKYFPRKTWQDYKLYRVKKSCFRKMIHLYFTNATQKIKISIPRLSRTDQLAEEYNVYSSLICCDPWENSFLKMYYHILPLDDDDLQKIEENSVF